MTETLFPPQATDGIVAISLWPPWSSLVALRVKTAETRGWACKHRGPLGIHATKNGCKVGQLGDYHVENDTPRRSERQYLLRGPNIWPYRLPLGAMVATCQLVDCVPTEHIRWTENPFIDRAENWDRGEDGTTWVHESERPYGNYQPDRFVWLLADIQPIRHPIPVKGGQRLWRWTP